MSLIMLYVERMAGYMIVALPFYLIFRIVLLKRKQMPVKVWREVVLAVFTLYLIGLASQTIIPTWSMGIISETNKFYFDIHIPTGHTKVNLFPFKTILHYFSPTNSSVDNWGSVSIINLVGNTLLFSPIGFCAPLLWSSIRSYKKVVLLGIGVTCFIEFTQFFIGRSTDIDDVILNTLGVVLGYILYVMVKRPSFSEMKGQNLRGS